jgi:hypothetical protein
MKWSGWAKMHWAAESPRSNRTIEATRTILCPHTNPNGLKWTLLVSKMHVVAGDTLRPPPTVGRKRTYRVRCYPCGKNTRPSGQPYFHRKHGCVHLSLISSPKFGLGLRWSWIARAFALGCHGSLINDRGGEGTGPSNPPACMWSS